MAWLLWGSESLFCRLLMKLSMAFVWTIFSGYFFWRNFRVAAGPSCAALKSLVISSISGSSFRADRLYFAISGSIGWLCLLSISYITHGKPSSPADLSL
ncbi:MAG: hypothetical protein J3Q66DRAFT_332995, partial [Benniella sp.]